MDGVRYVCRQHPSLYFISLLVVSNWYIKNCNTVLLPLLHQTVKPSTKITTLFPFDVKIVFVRQCLPRHSRESVLGKTGWRNLNLLELWTGPTEQGQGSTVVIVVYKYKNAIHIILSQQARRPSCKNNVLGYTPISWFSPPTTWTRFSQWSYL